MLVFSFSSSLGTTTTCASVPGCPPDDSNGPCCEADATPPAPPVPPMPPCDASLLVDECCAASSLEQFETIPGYSRTLQGMPLRCTVGNASACGGPRRGRCLSMADASAEAGWEPLPSTRACFFLDYLGSATTDSSSDSSSDSPSSDAGLLGICRCEAGYDRDECAFCALGYASDDGGGCERREAALTRRSLGAYDATQLATFVDGFVAVSPDADAAPTAISWTHNTSPESWPTTCKYAPPDPHGSGWFLLWHRVFFATTEQALAEGGYLPSSGEGGGADGCPYLNVTDYDGAGALGVALEPSLAFGGTCAVLPFEAVMPNAREVFSEEALLAPTTFGAFAKLILNFHVVSLCWFSAMSYISTDFCGPGKKSKGPGLTTLQILADANLTLGGDWWDESATAADFRAPAGLSCDCDEQRALQAASSSSSSDGSFVRELGCCVQDNNNNTNSPEEEEVCALHDGAGDDAALIFAFHMYLDALLEKWQQRHGRDAACPTDGDDVNALLLIDGASANGVYHWHPDQCLSQSVLNSFALSYRAACDDPASRLGYTFDFVVGAGTSLAPSLLGGVALGAATVTLLAVAARLTLGLGLPSSQWLPKPTVDVDDPKEGYDLQINDAARRAQGA